MTAFISTDEEHGEMGFEPITTLHRITLNPN